jgi:hypothetical protein
MGSMYNSRVVGPVTYLRIRCVELARKKRCILVVYNNRELWFTLQFVRNIVLGEDGYTRLSVPEWMFLQRIARDDRKKRRDAKASHEITGR